MLSYIRIFRPLNLLMIALTMLLVRYCIILPAFITEFNNTGFFPDHLSKIEFIILVFATVIIAAGGNIINDVFDVGIDEVNRPGKNIIGKKISEKTARQAAVLLLAAGSLCGIIISVKAGVTLMGMLLPFSAVSLYLYSSYYKKRLLIGNIIIALLSGLSVLIVALFEPNFYANIEFVGVYAIFAFMISLIRELIKDAEDMDGDERAQCKTFPILYGIPKTKILVNILIAINLTIIIYYLQKYFYHNTVISFWYLTGIFIIPFLALAYLNQSAVGKKDFHYASVFAKAVMLYGILTIIPFYYYFLK